MKGPSMNRLCKTVLSGLATAGVTMSGLMLSGTTVPAIAQSAAAHTGAAARPAASVRRLPLFVGGATLRNWMRVDPVLFDFPGVGTVLTGKGGLATREAEVLTAIGSGRYQVLHLQPDHLPEGRGQLESTRNAVDRLAQAAKRAGMKVVLARPLGFAAGAARDDEGLAQWMQATALSRGYAYADYNKIDFHPEIKVDRPAKLALVSNTVRGALDAAFRAVPGVSDAAVLKQERERLNGLPDEPGSGPYPAIHGVEPALPGAVVYRPANLTLFEQARLPVLIFGNGGCMPDASNARRLLTEIASHGYLVIVPGAMLEGPGGLRNYPQGAAMAPDRPGQGVTPADMTRMLDWASADAAGNGGWGRYMDRERIGVAGWSCGGLLALGLSPDPRIRTTIVFDSGLFPAGGAGMPGLNVDKSVLGKLHAPILYMLGGMTDVAYTNGTDDFSRINAVPAVLVSRDVGHSATFFEPQGGLWAAVARKWLDWRLKGDRAAASEFAGPDCRLCRDPDWIVRRNSRVTAP
jgi:dienelactone hydrolase